MQRKKMLIAVLAMVLLVGVVSAATIEWFGLVKVTTTVNQAVLVDNHGYPYVITEDATVSGGESFCRYHWLTSQTSVPVNLRFNTTFSPELTDSEITVTYYKLQTLYAEQKWEKIWGATPDLVEGNPLKVSVSYESDYVVFKATPPSNYDVEKSLTTFAFDVEPDGMADFQVQYNGTNQWIYSGVNTTSKLWFKDTVVGWQPVPAYLLTSITGSEFTLKVPIAVLGGCGSTYKFLVQTCGTPLHQTFYSTNPRESWYDASFADYVHSTYYVPMTLGTEIAGSFTLGQYEVLPFYICYKFAVDTYTYTYTITTTVK